MKTIVQQIKQILAILAIFAFSNQAIAQAPDKMSYQTVIRNSSNALITSAGVGIQISVLQGSTSGSAVFVERHFPTTNANGLVSLEIGTGTVVSGSFTGINWSAGPYFIKTETDPNGGASYSISGISELLSVPYALHAKTAESVAGGSAWTVSGNDVYSNNSGSIGIGTTTPTAKVQIDVSSPSSVGLHIKRGNDTKLFVDAYGVCVGDAVNIGSGDFYVAGTPFTLGGGSFAAYSDKRLKDRIVPFNDGLSAVLAIKPVKYHYTKKASKNIDTEKEYVGVIAQDLKEVAPYMVGTSNIAGKEYYNVNNSAMTYMLINGMQEQQTQIEVLKAENAALKASFKKIEAHLGLEIQGKK